MTLWGSSERYALPLLHLAAFFTARFVYGRDRNIRKNVFLDETHLMGVWGSGRALMVRLSRDSRKWNTAVGAASQHPDDHLSIGRIDALQGTAFVGRLTKEHGGTEGVPTAELPDLLRPGHPGPVTEAARPTTTATTGTTPASSSCSTR